MSTAESVPSVHPGFQTDLQLMLRSGQQIIVAPTNEIEACQDAVAVVAAGMTSLEGYNPADHWTVIHWDPVRGFSWRVEEVDRRTSRPVLDSSGQPRIAPLPEKLAGGTNTPIIDPFAALSAIEAVPASILPRCIFVLSEFHHFLIGTNVRVRSLWKSLAGENRLVSGAFRRPLLLVMPPHERLPQDIAAVTARLEFPLPDVPQIADIIDAIAMGRRNPVQIPRPMLDRLANSSLGLPATAVAEVAATALVGRTEIDESMLDLIEQRKSQAIGREGYLVYEPSKNAPKRGDLGGFECADDFLELAAQAYLPEAQGRLKKPRGVLLLGVAGTGKTQFARRAAGILSEITGRRFITYYLNIAGLYGGIVGQTEERVASVIQILRTQGNYVLVIDELEKLLGGDSQGDSGVSSRLKAQLLTWLGNRAEDPLDQGYVIGTMNTTKGIAPEFFRRFDSTFYTDMPTPAVRREIFSIHLRKSNIDERTILLRPNDRACGQDEWTELVDSTENFIGSEIEDVVLQAARRAFRARQTHVPTVEELLKAVSNRRKSTVWQTHQAEIQDIQTFCRKSATPVHEEAVVPARGARVRTARAVQ